MSAHAYTEDQLVEQPAIGLFAELGWTVAGPPPNASVAGEPGDAGLLGRETKGEVVRATSPGGIRGGANYWRARNSECGR